MFDRIKLRRVWRQKQDEHFMPFSDFPKDIFSVKRGVVHNDYRTAVFRQQRNEFKLKPIFKERRRCRMFIALHSKVFTVAQSCCYIRTFLSFPRLCPANPYAPFCTRIHPAIFSVQPAFINENEVINPEKGDKENHRKNVIQHVDIVLFQVGECLFFA